MCNRANQHEGYFHGVETEDEKVAPYNQSSLPIIIISFCPKSTFNIEYLDDKLKCLSSIPDVFSSYEKEGIVFVGLSETIQLKRLIRCMEQLSKFFWTDDICVTIKEDKLKCFLFQNMKIKFDIAPLEDHLKKIAEDKMEWHPIDLEDVLQFKSLFRHEGLVMRNIDSDVEINQNCLEYINQIVSAGLSNIKEELPMPTDPIYLMMPFPNIIPNIPILLKKDMPSYKDLWEGTKTEGKDKDRYIPTGDVLGYYKRSDESLCESPHIVLSPENIKNAAKDFDNQDEAFKVLMAKVLVHEIAHALMDHFTPEHYDNWPNTLEAKAMEESLANRITLEWFQKVDKDNYDIVKDFIKSQPTIYQFGIEQYDAHVDWRKWRLSDKNMPTLQAWFDKCFKDGDIISGLESKDVLEAYDAVFA